MKRIKTIYTLLLAVALTLLTACTIGDETTENGTEQKDGKVTVRFRVSQAAPAITRAADEWEDKDNAEDKEMMNVWTVIAVENTDGKVVGIWTCKPKGKPDQEVDDINEIKAKLNENTSYRFYSFANMRASYLNKLLFSNADIITDPTEDNQIVEIKTNLDDLTLTETQMNAITVKVEGNGFNKFTENDDNGFGYYGIPMSNVQTFNSLKNGDIKDLIVVRMLAKIKLEITNNGADNVTITSIALTDITQNVDNNLKLFPNYTNSNNANKMEAEHGDIQPNLNDNPQTEEYKITSSSNGVTVSLSDNPSTPSAPWTIETGKSLNIVFYVNESQTPTSNPKNNYNHFFLKINLSKNNGTQTETEERYTLIDDKNENANDKGKWDYIARNDYRIIPIVLDDYKLELIPYDFPAIGVYPASIKEEDGLYTITFHDYGHFHLVPKVTKFTTTGTAPVIYGTGWSLNGGTFKTAWESWNDHTKAKSNNVASFYATGDFADSNGNANINDKDDAGGQPVWYDNGASNTLWSKPQWSPTGDAPYEPFIFGYIADPNPDNGKMEGDKKVYHEFTIMVNNHLLTYRLYMILDQNQMLYRSRNNTAPISKWTYHCHE